VAHQHGWRRMPSLLAWRVAWRLSLASSWQRALNNALWQRDISSARNVMA